MFKPRFILTLSFCLLAAFGCNAPASNDKALAADVPLHLEDHLDAARIEGSDIPMDLPDPLEWRFANDVLGWKATVPLRPGFKQIQASHQDDALRLTLTKKTRNSWGYRVGSAHVELAGLNHDDWGFLIIEARTKDDIGWISPAFNLRKKKGSRPDEQGTFLYWGDNIDVINDGEVHSYVTKMDIAWPDNEAIPWTEFGISVGASQKEKEDSDKGPISIDIVSVKVIPREAVYAGSKAGTALESWGEMGRRALYMHVPGKIAYDIRIPDDARLDVGLGLLSKGSPVKFKISVHETGTGARPAVLWEETHPGGAPRLQRSVNLSSWSGKTVTLALETEAEAPGNVAFWGAPTLSGSRGTALPNIVFYVIDGAAAEFMSVYGYNRRTTPHLERLAAEGAVFEHAYSNSTWTQISVTSFMTSLHNSVLGGDNSEANPIPEQAVTMAERMHRAGYLTEVLTSNPYCGRMSSLDRGVDLIRDADPDQAEETPTEAASTMLNRAFWEIRADYPGQPYWVHFQPTDVHWPWKPMGPFAGLFATLEERKTLEGIFDKMAKIEWTNFSDRIEKSGVDRALFWQLSRKVYDECMAHQDAEIGRLVERIKDRGEWGNTLFVVAADHGHESAQLTLYDPREPKNFLYREPNFASQNCWIPMIFVWPGKIPAGRRFAQPVSMIDMLPTILDLAGLPPLEVAQGQSLAPPMLEKPGWTPRPVVFDEFYLDNKELSGTIEVIDGRWGASLAIDPWPEVKKNPPEPRRPAPLLVFDVWEDPHGFKSLHEERPDLVDKYTKMLEGIWKEHQALAKKFTRASSAPLTSAQIETLRSLGYLR